MILVLEQGAENPKSSTELQALMYPSLLGSEAWTESGLALMTVFFKCHHEIKLLFTVT